MNNSAGSITRALASLAGDNGSPAGNVVQIGLMGRGIQQSRSPAMHEREGARLGFTYRYALIDFDVLDLRDDAVGLVIDAAQRLGFSGLNVTHPLKQLVIRHLDSLSSEASAIASVNTIVLRDGSKIGHNTDFSGFAEGLRKGLPGRALGRVALFGAGGAGAAVAHALVDLGAESLAIIDPSRERAQQLSQRLARLVGDRVAVADDVAATVAAADGIVNATPIGMEKYPGLPLPAHLLAPRHWLADIVYFPVETELLRTGRAVGCTVVPGVGMAVYQAVRAFELFTGMKPDPAAMTAHFEAAA